MGICSIDGCGRDVYALGLCAKHYKRRRITGTTDDGPYAQEPLEKRFWKKVQKAEPNECWEWQGAISKNGYGVIGHNGTNRGAHRVSYEIHNGAVPAGMNVLHSCDNRSCVNPNHLRSGTQSENIKEAVDKGRKFVPCASGEKNPKSKLTQEQANYIKSNPGMRHTEIAKMFCVSPNTVRGVRIGRTWKD
jgi:hypothetical protein